MPLRLGDFIQCLTPRATENVAETEGNATNDASSSTQSARTSAEGDLPRRIRSSAPSFGAPGQSRRQAEGKLARFAIDTAVDRWAAADGGSDSVYAGLVIKNFLNNEFHSNPTPDGRLQSEHLRSSPPEPEQVIALPAESSLASSTLDLTAFQLRSIPAQLLKADRLRILDLRNTSLASLPSHGWEDTLLESLDASFNALGRLPAALLQAKALKKLDVSFNVLKSLPDKGWQDSLLESLGVQNNWLTALPGALLQAKALKNLDVNYNELKSLPDQGWQDSLLETLEVRNNFLIALPGDIGQAQALTSINASENRLATLPPKLPQLLTMLDVSGNKIDNLPPGLIASVPNLRDLYLNRNGLKSLPDQGWQDSLLKKLEVRGNLLAALPDNIGQAKALTSIDATANRLTTLPPKLPQSLTTLDVSGNLIDNVPPGLIASVPNLRRFNLRRNNLTLVPREFLEAHPDCEIDLRDNPLSHEDIRAFRAEMQQRRAAGLTVPQTLLPPIPGDPDDLREAAQMGMNVHGGVLTAAFKKRLDGLALQFPNNLIGSNSEQRREMKEIQSRWDGATNAYSQRHNPDSAVLNQASANATKMFETGQGTREAHYNEFQHVERGAEGDIVTRTAGHVVAFAFLAFEAQVENTPKEHRDEAFCNGMAALIDALCSAGGACDTRLCEEVLQCIGLPLTKYAQDHQETVEVRPAQIGIDQSREVVHKVAKDLLRQLLVTDPGLSTETPPAGWRETLIAKMQEEHPGLPVEHVEREAGFMQEYWEAFLENARDEPAPENP